MESVSKKVKISIIVFIVIILGIGGICVYQALTASNDSPSKDSKHNYKVTLVDTDVWNEGKIYKCIAVNGKVTDECLYDDDHTYGVLGYIDDMIVIRLSNYTESVYVYDKDGNTIHNIMFHENKDYYDLDASVDDDSIILTERVKEENRDKILCNYVKDEEYFERTTKCKYENKKFKEEEVVSKTINKEYRNKNNIKCSNSITISLVDDAEKDYIKYIKINDKVTDVETIFDYKLLGRIEDKIVIRVAETFDYGDVYVFDANGNYKSYGGYKIGEAALILYKAEVKDNVINLTSLYSAYDNSAICSKCASDDYIYMAEESLTYKNGDFERTTVSTKTFKEYQEAEDIKCETYYEDSCEYFEKVYGPKPTPTPVPTVKKVDVNSVKELHDDITLSGSEFFECGKQVYYNHTKFLAKDLSNNEILELTAQKLTKSIDTGTKEFTKDTFERTIKQLFGSDIKYEIKDYGQDGSSPYTITVNGEKVRIEKEQVGDLFQSKRLSFIVDAEKDEEKNEIYIYEKAFFAKSTYSSDEIWKEVYNGCDLTNLVDKKQETGSISDFELVFDNILKDVKKDDTLLDKINTYKFTFKSNGNETYYFYGVELVR